MAFVYFTESEEHKMIRRQNPYADDEDSHYFRGETRECPYCGHKNEEAFYDKCSFCNQ